MYYGYHCQHEKMLWDARTEPALIDAFAKIWDTKELLVSFDGLNFTLPAGAAGIPPSEPWPHVDQNPIRKGMQCVQGILNLAPNGPDDGGLLVMKGSHALNEQFFKAFPEKVGRGTWGSIDWFGFEKDEVKWFEDRGCEVIKVCAEPGDLIVWDSRTIRKSLPHTFSLCLRGYVRIHKKSAHSGADWNKLPDSQNLRAVMYICYTPASFATSADREKKIDYYNKKLGTTHWPHANIFHQEDKHLRLGKPDSYSRDSPVEKAEESDLLLKLAGVKAY